jgi:transcription antitermination factor NusB
VSARRIARELAVVVLPQIGKSKAKFEEIELDWLVTQAVEMLCNYAKESLAEADAFIEKTSGKMTKLEIEDENNELAEANLQAVELNTQQVLDQVDNLRRAISLIAEALDIPALALLYGPPHKCSHCGHSEGPSLKAAFPFEIRDFTRYLLKTYSEHRQEVDNFIKQIKMKWHLNRMVSIDRDILRLACTELFFSQDVPVSVVISEAVELCHRFADEKAAKFVNGVLADLIEEALVFRKTGVFAQKDTDSKTPAVS